MLRADLGVLMGDVVEDGEGWVVESLVGVVGCGGGRSALSPETSMAIERIR